MTDQVDPRGADLKQMLLEDDGGPVVMVNLLRFRPAGGQDTYRNYLSEAKPYLEEAGARVLHAGSMSTKLVGSDEAKWDAVLVVEYPSRQAFSAMVADPGYQHAARLRTEALSAAVLQATVPW